MAEYERKMGKPKIYKTLYVKIDSWALHNLGEIRITSEPMEAEDIVGIVGEYKGGFEITRLSPLYEAFKIASSKAGTELMNYLFTQKSINNIVYGGAAHIAKKIKVSVKTVRTLLKKLEDNGLIKVVRKTIMVNPCLMRKGNSQREAFLLSKYEAIKKDDTKEIDENEFNYVSNNDEDKEC